MTHRFFRRWRADEPPRQKSLLHEIMFEVFKVVILGLLAGVILHYFNYSLTRSEDDRKAERDFVLTSRHDDRRADRDLLNKRKERFGEAWAAVNAWETTVRRTIKHAISERRRCNGDDRCWRHTWTDRLASEFQLAREKGNELSAALDKERYWIGDDRYSELHQYRLLLTDLLLERSLGTSDEDLQSMEAKLSMRRTQLSKLDSSGGDAHVAAQ